MSDTRAPRPSTLANRERYGTVTERAERVIAELRIRDGPATVGALAAATGLPPTIVGSVLGHLAHDRRVRRTGKRWEAR